MARVKFVFHHKVPPPHGEIQLAFLSQVIPVLSPNEYYECLAHAFGESWEEHVESLKVGCHAGVFCHVEMTRCKLHVLGLAEFVPFSRECVPSHVLVFLNLHVQYCLEVVRCGD